MLEHLVKECARINGEGYVISNVHNLLHVYEEVVHFGPLRSLSAYPSENHLQLLKHLLRHGYKNLEQVINRLSELDYLYSSKTLDIGHSCYLKKYGDEVTIYLRNFLLRIGPRDGWFLSSSFDVVRFNPAESTDTGIKVHGQIIREKKEYFHRPISSAVLLICQSNINSVSGIITEFNPCNIIAKYCTIMLN